MNGKAWAYRNNVTRRALAAFLEANLLDGDDEDVVAFEREFAGRFDSFEHFLSFYEVRACDAKVYVVDDVVDGGVFVFNDV